MPNTTNSKKAQITIFIIIALCLVIAGALVIHYLSFQPGNLLPSSQLQADQASISTLIHSCLESSTSDAMITYGLEIGTSEILIEQYIKDYLPACTANFQTYRTEGFTVTKGTLVPKATINEDALVVEIDYPLTFTKDGATIKFEKDLLVVPRNTVATLKPDADTIVMSWDRKTQFIIPKGTQVTLNGEPITQIGMEILDREHDGRSNSVVMGMMIFNGTPEGATFSESITITHQYSQSDVPSTVDETKLRIAYYSEKLGVWIAMPTTVDTVNNILRAQTTHFTEFGVVIRCTEDEAITEHITPVLVKEDCQACEGWTNGNSPSEEVGPLWIKSDAITQGSKIGQVPECKKTVIPTTTVPVADETYYSYDAIAIEGINPEGYTEYAADGDSCIWVAEDREPKIVVQDTANPEPGEDWDILLKATCTDEKDQCLIPEYPFEESRLKHTLKVINGEAPNACIDGKIILQYQGFGIEKDNEESYYLCGTEGEEKEMPIIGGEPTQTILSACVCENDGENDVCKWVPKEGAEVQDDPVINRRKVKEYAGDGFPSCPDDFQEKYLGVVFKTTRILDTRTRGDVTDNFGDFPFMQYEKTLFNQFDKDTELLVFGSAFMEGQCWLLVEAQKWVEARLEHPDFYVKLEQVQAAIDGTEVPEDNPNPYYGPGATGTGTSGTSGTSGTGTTSYGKVGSATKCGKTDSVEGIDVSHWQGTIDWDKVAADDHGVEFVFMKSSQGTSFVDDQFSRNWKEAKRVGLLRGAYHYMDPGNGKAQAEHFLSVLGSDYGELPPVIDVEEPGISPADVKAWLDVVEQETGLVPMIYVSPGYWWSFGGGSEFSKYHLWTAHWGVSCPRIPSVWTEWTFWQYCGTCLNPVDGIGSKELDLNVFNGNLEELKAYSASVTK